MAPYGYDYKGPNRRVLQTANAVMMGGDILAISPPAANSTWTDKFFGPSLSCTGVQGEDLHAFLTNIAQYISVPGNCDQAAAYLSWIRQNGVEGIDMPYKPSATNVSILEPFNGESLMYASSNGPAKNVTAASFYVALLPHMLDVFSAEFSDLMACSISSDEMLSPTKPLASMGEDATLIQCNLMNSLYTTTFNFVDGSQHLDVKVDKLEGGVDIVKTVQWSHVPNDCLQSDNDRFNSSDCTFDHGVLWRLSYQSIMNAFSSLLTGQVTANAGYEARNFNTSVTLTSLIDTEEFGFLDEDYLKTGLSSNLQDFVADVNVPETLGITYPNQTSVRANQRHYAPLHQTLEELFQNVTLRLMSFPELWYV